MGDGLAGQGVVVTETQLGPCDGIVLIDHRHHAERQQAAQGAARIQVAFAGAQVIVGQQHLRRMQVVALETLLPGLHQAHLPDRGRSLQVVHGGWPALPAEAAHALGHGA